MLEFLKRPFLLSMGKKSNNIHNNNNNNNNNSNNNINNNKNNEKVNSNKSKTITVILAIMTI